jgi:hypothetical protein
MIHVQATQATLGPHWVQMSTSTRYVTCITLIVTIILTNYTNDAYYSMPYNIYIPLRTPEIGRSATACATERAYGRPP